MTACVSTEHLEIAYLESGPVSGPPVVLMHGFPYSPHAYEEVAVALAEDGCRVIVPYMRGFGPTRFRDPGAFRSGEQAAFGQDLLALIDALGLARPLLVGYDWGGRAACVVAAVWPQRVRGLVTVTGYNMFGPPTLGPREPAEEQKLWYQYYLLMHRGRQMLSDRRSAFAHHLWRDWSPNWAFTDATFARSAAAFENPDFVEVVLHSYRHRHGQVPGDPALADLQALTESRPAIPVPTIGLHGDDDFLSPTWSDDDRHFSGPHELRRLPGIGHNLPQESPAAVIAAVRDLLVVG